MRRKFTISRSVSCETPRLWRYLEQSELFLGEVPPLKRVRVLASEADIKVLEIDHEGARDPVTLELVVAGSARLSFFQVDRFRGQGVSGEIVLKPEEGGGTILTLHLHLPLRLIGLARASRVARCCDAALEALQATMKTRPIKLQAAVPKKLLEIRREGDSIKVWLRGKTFELPEGPTE